MDDGGKKRKIESKGRIADLFGRGVQADDDAAIELTISYTGETRHV